MSLFQSFTVGVSGMKSQASKIGVVSDNIANVNTVGYKGGIAQFHTLVNEFASNAYIAGGVKPGTQQTNQKSGLITNTDSATDLAISGRGFFAVSAESAVGSSIVYTRAGSFSKNEDGDFVNSAGYFLKGWLLDENGNLPAGLDSSTITQSAAEAALQSINVDNLSIAAITTSSISLQANLKSTATALANSNATFVGNLSSTQAAAPSTTVAITSNLRSAEVVVAPTLGYDPMNGVANMASGIIPPNYSVPVTAYDAAGTERTLKVSYLKTAANTWAVEIYAPQTSDITPATGFPAGLIASGTVTFNGDGTLATISPELTTATAIDWNSPSSTSTLAFNFGTVGTATNIRQSTDSYTGLSLARPDYNPTVDATSMTSGAVAPHYTTTLSVTDNTGVPRDVALNFIKTGTNMWDVEVTAQPITDLIPGTVPGQIAYGSVTFNADGALATISPSLSNPLAIDWINTTEINSLEIDWGTPNLSNGLSQLNAAFSGSSTIVQNYSATDDARNMTSGAVTPQFNRPISVVDSGGNLRTLNFNFLKTNTNTWSIEIAAGDATDVTSPTALIAHGVVTFNGNGTLASMSASLSDPIDIAWSSGPATVQLDLGTIGLGDGMTQFDTMFQVRSLSQNGSVAGENAEISIDEDGFVIGTYANGSVRRLYQIPLAEFLSPDKLEALSSNIFSQTRYSGAAVYFQPGSAQESTIGSNSLEASNVDMANELSNMLIAQRAYQSNSKLITTTNSMLETLTQM